MAFQELTLLRCAGSQWWAAAVSHVVQKLRTPLWIYMLLSRFAIWGVPASSSHPSQAETNEPSARKHVIQDMVVEFFRSSMSSSTGL